MSWPVHALSWAKPAQYPDQEGFWTHLADFIVSIFVVIMAID
jgi:hypothetical protein